MKASPPPHIMDDWYTLCSNFESEEEARHQGVEPPEADTSSTRVELSTSWTLEIEHDLPLPWEREGAPTNTLGLYFPSPSPVYSPRSPLPHSPVPTRMLSPIDQLPKTPLTYLV